MSPLSFGAPERRLFGLYHPAETAGTAAQAVLLCAPFGHEAIRSHRLFRVLADRLSRIGCAVLRLDYYGTGDADGDDEDGDLLGWARDVRTAHAELERRSGAERITWFGARLGATLALDAASALPMGLERLVLWDPVIDGVDYGRTLRERHVEALERRYRVPSVDWRRRLESDPSTFTAEAIGFAIAPLLRSQLDAIDASRLNAPQGMALHVIADPDDRPVLEWSRRQAKRGAVLHSVALRHALGWTSDPTPYSAIVPPEVVHRVLEQFSESLA